MNRCLQENQCQTISDECHHPALEILDEVHQSNPVDSLEICCDLEKMHFFRSQEDPGMV